MLKELNPIFHSQLRLAIVSLLLSVEEADFVYLKEQTKASSGNLSVQLNKLSEAGYINVEKSFVGKIPRTSCKLTSKGRDALEEYVNNLKEYFKDL
ncbi:MAG: transcriptional regulator [Bacteroidales bacterium]